MEISVKYRDAVRRVVINSQVDDKLTTVRGILSVRGSERKRDKETEREGERERGVDFVVISY